MDARSAFIFRADGNAGLGHGHLVRCLTLAAELERQGGRILFVAREFGGALRDKLDWRSYELHCSLCSDIGGGRAVAWRDDPTLNPKFVEMARYAKSRGIKEVSSLTTAVQISREPRGSLLCFQGVLDELRRLASSGLPVCCPS